MACCSKSKTKKVHAQIMCFEENLEQMLEIYTKKGILKADDALERALNHAALPRASQVAVTALQFLVRKQLGFNNRTYAVRPEMYPNGSLANAVCSWASFVSNTNARQVQYAQNVVQYAERRPGLIPQGWVDEAMKYQNPKVVLSKIKDNSVSKRTDLNAKQQWNTVIKQNPNACPIMREILHLSGIEKVKDTFVTLYHRAMLAKKQGDLESVPYNAIFEGNPGTGKSTVAEHYVTFLQQLHILDAKSTKLITIPASFLLDQGVKLLNEEIKQSVQPAHSVVLIEDAPELLSSREGKQVLNYIYSATDARQSAPTFGNITWLFTGLPKVMKTLLAEKSGWASRFPVRFCFEDLADEELLSMFKNLMERKSNRFPKVDDMWVAWNGHMYHGVCMGLLSKGEVIYKTASDFIGDVMGSSEEETRKILQSAQGSVLVIDEAYCFHTGDGVVQDTNVYGKPVINTIVEQVPAKPGDDRAVLLLGYKHEMENMLKMGNPGLTRRFQLENAFVFEDYDDEALLRILFVKVKQEHLYIDFDVAKRAVASLAKARAKPHFGNAGALENMLSEAKLRVRPETDCLTLQDFGLTQQAVAGNILPGLAE